jgi:hypothetical protein
LHFRQSKTGNRDWALGTEDDQKSLVKKLTIYPYLIFFIRISIKREESKMKESLRYLNNASEILKAIPVKNNTCTDMESHGQARGTSMKYPLTPLDVGALRRASVVFCEG